MAAFIWGDCVQDTAASVSGSTVTLNGTPPTGFRSFNTGIGDGNYTVYKLADASGNWEINYGVYTNSGLTLARFATPISSSNAGAQVASFTGQVNVFCDNPAADIAGKNWGITSSAIGQNAFFTAAPVSGSQGAPINYIPVWIKQPFSAIVLYIRIITLYSGSSTVALGLYSNNKGSPFSLLGSQSGINVGTGGSTGVNATSSIVMPSPMLPGLYWAACSLNTHSPTLYVSASTNLLVQEVMGGASVASITAYSGFTGFEASLPSSPSVSFVTVTTQPTVIGYTVAF